MDKVIASASQLVRTSLVMGAQEGVEERLVAQQLLLKQILHIHMLHYNPPCCALPV